MRNASVPRRGDPAGLWVRAAADPASSPHGPASSPPRPRWETRPPGAGETRGQRDGDGETRLTPPRAPASPGRGFAAARGVPVPPQPEPPSHGPAPAWRSRDRAASDPQPRAAPCPRLGPSDAARLGSACSEAPQLPPQLRASETRGRDAERSRLAPRLPRGCAAFPGARGGAGGRARFFPSRGSSQPTGHGRSVPSALFIPRRLI